MAIWITDIGIEINGATNGEYLLQIVEESLTNLIISQVAYG